MEASSAFHRCVWQAFTRPVHCRHINSSIKPLSIPSRQNTTRTSRRNFASASQTNQQGQPPQRIPVSEHRDNADAVGLDPPQPREPPLRDPSKRIDLSSLPNIPPDYKPPPPPPARPKTANAKLDALFNKPFNPFAQTIQRTDALTPSKPVQSDTTTWDITKLFEGTLHGRGPPRPETDYKLPLRLKPTLGRIQAVDPSRGLDLAKSFRLLESKCGQNKVAQDSRNQRFHVRRGQARKLRRIANWRKAFQAGFLEECARIRRMKNQGW